jgi:fructose-1,6-bisphosphatase II / sedoheptulose-1,7-bisphosphatase
MTDAAAEADMNQEVRFARGAPALDRILTLEVVRVTERAAVAAARLRGRGDEIAADQAAVDAMRRELNRLAIDGRVVIGEGERDEAPMLYIGEEVGTRQGPSVDIALDPLEGTTIAAKNLPNAIAVIAIAETGTLLAAPDVYMDKIAIGPGYPKGIVDLDRTPADNIRALAKAKGVAVGEVSACVLDRPRHARLIEELRSVGAAIRLIGDGDVAGIIHTTEPEITGIDIYLGIGGAPEGVLAAAALRCTGGQMQGRLVLSSDEQKDRARRFGVRDLAKKYDLSEMARGDVVFAATGVTDGNILAGVSFGKRAIVTHSVVMRASSGTVRWIKAEHQDRDKFDDDR